LRLLHDEAGNTDPYGSTIYTPGLSQRRDGADAYFHGDWIGSTRYLTNSTGLSAPTAYRYDAYGQLSAQAGPDVTSSKFAGRHGYESDAPAGLLQLGARLYDPVVGRFLNPDPIGLLGGLNLYEYCFGNPVNAVDPSGLEVYGWGPEDADALHQFNRQVNRWIGEQSGNIARAVVSVADTYGIADAYEAFTGDELFTPNRLSVPERAVTVVLAAVPCVPTNVVRSILRIDLLPPALRPRRGGDPNVLGDFGQQQLAAEYPGGRPRVKLPTGGKDRYVDWLVGGVAHEAKVGYTDVNTRTKEEIAKDVWLLGKRHVKQVVWHFYKNPNDGKGGASPGLLFLLRQSNIDYVIHE
jgi:RHS repeat-associated protein